MPEILNLPAYVTARSGDAVVSLCTKALLAEDDVEIDGRRLKFADPFGMAMLGSTFFSIREKGAAVRVRGLRAEIGGYLQRMDVFEGVELIDCEPQEGRRWDRSDALVELTRLDQTARADATAYNLARALVGHIPDVDPNEAPDQMTGYTSFDRLVEPLQYALSELLENALTHARGHGYAGARVWVASQYYRSNDLVRLGVVDDGCGFLASLRGHPALQRESHLSAVQTALQARVSCNRDLGVFKDSANEGVGLTTTCRIAEQAGGRMIIISGNGWNDTSGRSIEMSPASHWQGVGIAMECSRNLLTNIRYGELLPSLDVEPPAKLRFE